MAQRVGVQAVDHLVCCAQHEGPIEHQAQIHAVCRKDADSVRYAAATTGEHDQANHQR